MATKAATATIDKFISNWNLEFPEYNLTTEDLKRAPAVISALFKIFDRLGVDLDAVLAPPTEKNLNENIVFYWDLVPVINITRVINHMVAATPHMAKICINHFLQPSVQTSHSILLLLFNILLFNDQRLQSISELAAELFDFMDMVRALEEKRNDLFEQLNKQAQEKAKRSDRMEQLHLEIQQLEDEIREEEAARDQEKLELDPIIKENNSNDHLVDQKTATMKGLLAEQEKKKAMRVYDAQDIRNKAAEATQNAKEMEEKLTSLINTRAQKEDSLRILGMIIPYLKTANRSLREIADLVKECDALQDDDSKDREEQGDFDDDSRDKELPKLRNDLKELQAQEAEIDALRQDVNKRRLDGQARKHHEKTLAESALIEAEDKDKKRREFTQHAAQRTQEIKQLTTQYAEEKEEGFRTIQQIKDEYNRVMEDLEQYILDMLQDAKANMAKKQSSLVKF